MLQYVYSDSIDFKNPKLKKHPHVLDLLQRMLEVNPNKRVSAREALDHQFFKSFGPAPVTPATIKEDEAVVTNLKEFKEAAKKVAAQGPADGSSFVQRDGVINGELNTVNETNSDAGILSFKNVGRRQAPVDNANKRESIFKYVLVKENAEKQSS